MPIRGQTKNVVFEPKIQKNINPKETWASYNIDIRNGRLTDAGNYDKRNGFGDWKNVGLNESVDLLIPEDNGYAVTSSGRIFSLGNTIAELSGSSLIGRSRPLYSNFNDKYIMVNGGAPVKITFVAGEGFVSSPLGGEPPNARFIASIGAHVLMAGQTMGVEPTKEIRHSAINLEETYVGDTSGSFWVKNDGQRIRNIKAVNEVLLVFKDKSAETWINIASSTKTFIRQQAGWIDTGCGADYSVVTANDTVYWFGHDGRFYGRLGGIASVISNNIERYVFDTITTFDMYGIDFPKDNCIKWFLPIAGKCFVYDYKFNQFYEYNTWNHGQWERMPIKSYMELNGKQYIGDFEPTGNVFEWSDKYKSDNGRPIRMFREFAIRPSARGNNARLNRVGFRFDRGVGNSSEPKPVLFWRYRTDHGDWMNYQTLSLGRGQDNNPYIEVHPGIVGREFEFELVATDNVDVLLTNMDATFEEMGR